MYSVPVSVCLSDCCIPGFLPGLFPPLQGLFFASSPSSGAPAYRHTFDLPRPSIHPHRYVPCVKPWMPSPAELCIPSCLLPQNRPSSRPDAHRQRIAAPIEYGHLKPCFCFSFSPFPLSFPTRLARVYGVVPPEIGLARGHHYWTTTPRL